MKRLAPLLLAFGAPIVLIGVVALFIWIPQMRVHPTYDIMYASNAYRPFFTVREGVLTSTVVNDAGELIASSTPGFGDWEVKQTAFHRYNPETGVSTEIGSYAIARLVPIVSVDASPDGYTVSQVFHNGNGSIMPFFYDSYRNDGYAITGHGGKKRMKGVGNSYNVKIVGWIAR